MIHLRLLALLGTARARVALLVGLGLAVAATHAGQALVTATIFGRLLQGGGGDVGPVVGRLWQAGALLVALLVARPILLTVREVAATAVMTSVKVRLRDDLAVALVRRSAVADGTGRTGGDHALVVDGVENLDPYLSRYVPQLAVTALVFAAVGTALVVIDPLGGIVVVVAALALAAAPRAWDRALSRHGADHWGAYEDMHAQFHDSLQGMTTLVTFGAAERRQLELAAASGRLLRSTLRQLRLSLVESGLNTFALSAVPLLALVVVVARPQAFTAVSLFAFVLLSLELVRPLRDLAAQWHAGYAGTFSGAQILDVLGSAPAASGSASTTRRVQPAASAGVGTRSGAGLVIDAISYTYPGAESASLRALSTTLAPGVTVVLGASGGGKSTLALLLAGLDAPTSGSIDDGGGALAPADLLARVALVPQDPVLFAGTVAENLRRAAPSASPTQVARAAALVGIGGQSGLDLGTAVGEGGALVSGGQRQRVAIARAVLAEREVLVLDEATSALDVHGEHALLRALAEQVCARPDGVLVVIAHRLEVVDALAEAGIEVQVRVVADGRVVESGTAAALGTGSGSFAALVAASTLRAAAPA